MSVNSGKQDLSLLNGKSIQLESPVTVSTVSQQLLSPNVQSVQLNPPAMIINPVSQQLPKYDEQQTWLRTSGIAANSSLHSSSPLNRHLMHLESPNITVGMDSQHLLMTNKHLLLDEFSSKFHNVMHGSLRPLQSLPAQRQVADMKFLPHSQSSMFLNLASQQLALGSKAVRREPWPKIISSMPASMGSHQLSTIQKGKEQSEQSPKFQKPSSGTARLQKSSSINKRGTQHEPSSKAPSESFELVRSKMRESLAASLVLASDEKIKGNSVGKYSSSADTSTLTTTMADGQPGNVSSLVDASSNTLGCSLETLNSSEQVAEKLDDMQNSSSLLATEEQNEVQKFQQKTTLLEEDEASNEKFVVTDELLQGNGLCWVSELGPERDEASESHNSKRCKMSNEKLSIGADNHVGENPQNLAAKIEAELFKLFGGVNKKYKEKGRSLLFNLKDPNNPELRKQVLSGEIAAERLCSMTAEELASKELSEWRIAKAEEFAQMVVLPDSDIDMRRLVKKTHKGEVEVERDDSVSVEVTLGATPFLQTSIESNADKAQTQIKSNKRKAQVLSKSNGSQFSAGLILPDEVDAVGQTPSNNLTDLPHEKADFMDDIIMEELKEEELLEQVPSLDEFMKDLDSEPPFKNLTLDIVHETTISSESNTGCLETKLDPELGSPDSQLDITNDASGSNQNHGPESSGLKPDPAVARLAEDTDTGLKDSGDPVVGNTSEVGVTDKASESNLKVDTIHIDSDMQNGHGDHKGDHVWEGLIQLNISSLVTVLGSYQSGEQTSTKEWPGFLEIKGRVRLDAFEKFLQELPLSRSRATMILQFSWKEGSPESGRQSLCETIESYIADERVGYAEPAPGVEIYFCPPHAKITQIIMKQLTKEPEEILSSADNGLLGVVVWRRPHVTSTMSPRSSSHKNNSKKQSISRKQQNMNPNSASMSRSILGPAPVNQKQSGEEEPFDDAPPGFGPGATREEDDLPEFDFTQSSKTSAQNLNPSQAHPSSRPVEQIRQLIHKYGHGESSNSPRTRVNQWNDDDDDIPEWQPHKDIQSHPPPPPPSQLHGYQQQAMQPQPQPFVGNHLIQVQPQQQPKLHLPNVLPHQQLVPLAPSLQPIPQLGFIQGVQSVPHAGWQQPGQWWAPQMLPTGVGFPSNGTVHSYGQGGQPPPIAGQSYGMQGAGYPQEGVEWRHDVSRSR